VKLCHKRKHTILVDASAVQAHLDHGDKLGPCKRKHSKHDKKKDRRHGRHDDRHDKDRDDHRDKDRDWWDLDWVRDWWGRDGKDRDHDDRGDGKWARRD
jgi:hypothetical protein